VNQALKNITEQIKDEFLGARISIFSTGFCAISHHQWGKASTRILRAPYLQGSILEFFGFGFVLTRRMVFEADSGVPIIFEQSG
jgi:hypothetical protein